MRSVTAGQGPRAAATTGGLPPDVPTDAALLRASVRDSDVFAVLYDRHADRLYRYAYRRVGPDVADDVVADAFLAAFRQRARYDHARPDALPWLFGITTREISRHRRQEKSRFRALARIHTDPASDDLAERVADDVSAQAVRGQLAAALAPWRSAALRWGCCTRRRSPSLPPPTWSRGPASSSSSRR